MCRGGTLVLLCAILPLSSAQAGTADIVRFNRAEASPLKSLLLGEFAPGTIDRGDISDQTPTVRLPVSDVQLLVRTGGDSDCGPGIEAGAALSQPSDVANAPLDDDTANGCLFEADVTITSARGALKAVGQCGTWHGDVSYCPTDGDQGQFWLRRKTADAMDLELIMGPVAATAWPVMLSALPGQAAPKPLPSRGIMLESVVDDAGRPVTDRWLLLPAEALKIELER
jgi:hypothetical protein